ncbi:MAG TPA: GNAT family N-acetyltransferase [Vicinamibacterales bacterium]|nr:GNAT family N-acetyltransferase [Vicinamibacterales bacterium]
MTIRQVIDADWPRIGELGDLQVRAHYAFDSARFFSPDELPPDVYTSLVREEVAAGRATVLVAEVVVVDDLRPHPRPPSPPGGTEVDERDGGRRRRRIAGYVFAAIEAESWKELRHEAGLVHDLVVEETHRRRGIGAALLRSAIDWFAARGVTRVMLGTAPQNVQAQALFRRAGFRPTMIEMTMDR